MKSSITHLILLIISICAVYGQQTANFQAGNKMDTQEFWKIIDYSKSISRGDQKAQEATIIQLLTKYTPGQIVDFEIILRRMIINADDFKVLAVEQMIDGRINDGLYLSFRCWLISMGEKAYTETLKNPEYLADKIEKQTHTEFKELLYVATDAYQQKTHKQTEDAGFPRNVADAKGLDLEFTEYPTRGPEWKEAQLPKLYPKLWAKLH